MTCLGVISRAASKLTKPASEAEELDEEVNYADVSMLSKRRRVRRHLPVGKGPYTVGVVDIMCESGENGTFFRLYYPTSKTDIYTRDRQWPLWLPHKKYGLGYVHFLQWNPAIFGKIFNWLGGDVYVPALWQSLPLRSNTPYPVIVFSHGLGGNRTCYTTFCVEMASQGFVVAAIEHRDGSASMTLCLKNNNQSTIRACTDFPSDACDGPVGRRGEHGPQSQHHHHNRHNHHKLTEGHHHSNYFMEEWKSFEHVEKWDDFDYRNGQMYKRAEECRRVLDLLVEMNAGATIHNTLGIAFDTKQFKSQLDLEKVCLIGHSFGGSTCLATCSTDRRFKVGVVLDGWMHPVDDKIFSTLQQPLLMINMESFQWPVNIKQMMRLLDGVDADRTMITVKGTCHQSVTDFQFLCNKAMGRLMEVRYKLSPSLCMDMACKATLGFLSKNLDLESIPPYQEVLSGEHDLIISGTNVTWM